MHRKPSLSCQASYSRNSLLVLASVLTILTVNWMGTTVIKAAGGDLDTTFQDPAVFHPSGTVAWDIALQSDGKVVIGGRFASVGGQQRGNVARLNANGTLDTTFQNPAVEGGDVQALALQPDGKVLIGGSFDTVGGAPRQFVARLNANGTLDTTFQNSALDNTVLAIVIQTDGKVLIGGHFTSISGQSQKYLARLNTDGTLDTTFPNQALDQRVQALALQPDGKVLIGGYFTTAGGSARRRVARLNADGTLDTSFQVPEVLTSDTNSGVFALAVQADGKVLIGGERFTSVAGQQQEKGVTRVNADGALDTSFANTAVNFVRALALQTDGKLLIGGLFSLVGGQQRDGVARLNIDGTLDASFGNPGVDQVLALSLQPDGKLLLGGWFTTVGGQVRRSIGRIETGTFVSVFSVGGASPSRGGNAGIATTRIFGSGFLQGATVRLMRAGQPDILPATATVDPGRSVITAVFDLTGKTPGAWDVRVTNPDGSSSALTTGFTIEQGGAPRVWADIVGRRVIRPQTEQTYYIVYGNSGNMDAYGVPVWLGGIPKDATVKFGWDIRPKPLEGEDPSDLDDVSPFIERGSEKLVPLYVPYIPAGQTGSLKITLSVPTTAPFTLVSWANPPEFRAVSTQAGDGAANRKAGGGSYTIAAETRTYSWVNPKCSGALVKFAVEQAIDGLLGDACTDLLLKGVLGTSVSFIDLGVKEYETTGSFQKEGPKSLILSGVQAGLVGLKCAFDQVNPLHKLKLVGSLVEAVLDAYDVFSQIDQLNELAENCSPPDNTPPPPPVIPRQVPVQVVTSFDPNDKVGSLGAGAGHHLPTDEPLRYIIFFENKESASAAAQEVIVTDQLDVTKYDLSTFQLGAVSFADKLVTPPSGLSQWTTDVDLRPAQDLIVRITAGLDKQTGIVTWRFTSLDPATLLPTEDPLAGFLNPNRTPPEGEGGVLFFINAKPGLATGAEIRNKARIVFDTNPHIDTPEWLNTVDNSKPASQVAALSAMQNYTTFKVKWEGTDTGSGLKQYTVFVSENGGPFTAWLRDTTASSAFFRGEAGKSYAFFSVAQDQAGNQEQAPVIPDSSTQVSATAGNIIEDASFFIRQQYLDFLVREPEAAGLQFYLDILAGCQPADVECKKYTRGALSANFFRSPEFQRKGSYVMYLYMVAVGQRPATVAELSDSTKIERPHYAEFISDLQSISVPNDDSQLTETKKAALADAWISRAEFQNKYPGNLSPAAFVQALVNTAGVTLANQAVLVDDLTQGRKTRAQVLRAIAESAEVDAKYYKAAFVTMEYFGYLRRDPEVCVGSPNPDQCGYIFHNERFKLAADPDFLENTIVRGFIESPEYRRRFGPN
jgi:uncharacterized delta-60 repeat protein